jgi:hypothetical protein
MRKKNFKTDRRSARTRCGAGFRRRVLSLTTHPARKRNQGLDEIKKHIATLCPEDTPVFFNASHNISSPD